MLLLQIVLLFQFLFSKEQVFSTLDDNDRRLLAESFPNAQPGQLVDVLVESGLAGSKGEARKFITGNAISVNGQKVNEDITVNTDSLIKRGKNKFAYVR